MYVRINYENGYPGCDESEVIEVDSLEEAEEWAIEGSRIHAETYEYLATSWDGDFESDEERKAYYDDCSYYIEEITEAEFLEENSPL